MMKGFKKDGKFRPTEKQSSGISSSQIRSKKSVISSTGKASEIREKKSYNHKEPILETELTDILTDITDGDVEGDININKLNTEVANNIKYVLEREKKWNKNNSVIISKVIARNGDDGFYQYDYYLLDDNKPTKLNGTAYGSISAGDIIDMTLELYKGIK